MYLNSINYIRSYLSHPRVVFYYINYIEVNMKQWLKDFTHNCIVHPLMMFIPKKWANELHDRNANWAFGLDRYDELKLENKK